jgi:hypothetical protein
VYGDPELLYIVGALGSRCCLPNSLNGGEQERNQYCDDGDYHQQLDQREASQAVRPA